MNNLTIPYEKNNFSPISVPWPWKPETIETFRKIYLVNSLILAEIFNYEGSDLSELILSLLPWKPLNNKLPPVATCYHGYRA